MNPNAARAPSRFIRGRGRGGGAYRPYFYFRRNGRVIPAGGPNQRNGAAESGQTPSATNANTRGARSFGSSRRTRAAPRTTPISASFLRPENYAAPEDAENVQCIAVENPPSCPGWRLYFLRDTYVETSESVKRIKAVENHYQRNPTKYDFLHISESGYFALQSQSILKDAAVTEAWPSLSDDLRKRPLRTLSTLAAAMHSVATANAIDAKRICQDKSTPDIYVPSNMRIRKIYVRPENFVDVQLITSIAKTHVDQLYSVRGIVSTLGDLELNSAWIGYECTRCEQEQALRQKSNYKSQPFHCKNPKCTAKRGFRELRSSPYTRLCVKQLIRIEESNLQLLTDYDKTLPGVLDIELRHDLVNSVAVGMEIIVTGVLKMCAINSDEPAAKSLKAAVGYSASNELQIYMKAVTVQNAKYIKRCFSERDIEAIGMINNEPDSFKLLVQSLTPEVHGHEMAKAGCLLSLFGGAGSQVADDVAINVLLVGDPGIGKSKILQTCAQVSERGAHVSGKRAVLFGQKMGVSFDGRNKRNLQTGALLAASTGHCTVDDIDKLMPQQGLMLQTLQSQEINLPYPSTFAMLGAQPSIIACANPQRGQYDQGRLLLQNVRIMPALLREFHLAFVLLDQPNKNRDISLTEHVRALHAGVKKRAHIANQYALKPKTNDSTLHSFGFAGDEDTTKAEDYDLAQRLALNELDDVEEMDLLPPVLMKKFIAYARQSVQPLLNDEASSDIKQFFMELRARTADGDGHSNIGISQLLGLIHLAQARSRIDLSAEVTKSHVRDVIALVSESMAQTCLRECDAPEMGTTSKSAQLKRFLQVMQERSKAVGRSIFDFDELKEIARRAGISCGVTNLVDIANMQGFLLKKGRDIYEILPD